MRAELLKGHVDAMLLAVLEDRPAHGYAIIERLRHESDGAFELAEGTVYPALHRLERTGLLGSRTDTVNGRERRTYSLSRRGRSALEASRREWSGFANAVGVVLKVSPA